MPSVINQEISSVRVIHLRQSNNGTTAKLPEKGESNILIIYPLSGTIILRTHSDKLLCHSHSVCLLDERDIAEIDLIESSEGFAIIVSNSLVLEICATDNLIWDDRKKEEITRVRLIPVDELFQAEVRSLVCKLAQISAITFSYVSVQKHLLRIFLLYIFFGQQEPESGFSNCRDQDLTNRFMQLVDQATAKKTIEQYAMELQISRNYLSRTFKKCSGQSPIRYIQQRFIQAAQKLACQTPLSMKEVGYRLGFDDPAHFSKFFKMNTGLNFTEYKKQVIARINSNKQEQ